MIKKWDSYPRCLVEPQKLHNMRQKGSVHSNLELKKLMLLNQEPVNSLLLLIKFQTIRYVKVNLGKRFILLLIK